MTHIRSYLQSKGVKSAEFFSLQKFDANKVNKQGWTDSISINVIM